MSDKDFRRKLEHLLNSESMENGSNTPDFILADFLFGCLRAFDAATARRDVWYDVKLCPGDSHYPPVEEKLKAFAKSVLLATTAEGIVDPRFVGWLREKAQGIVDGMEGRPVAPPVEQGPPTELSETPSHTGCPGCPGCPEGLPGDVGPAGEPPAGKVCGTCLGAAVVRRCNGDGTCSAVTANGYCTSTGPCCDIVEERCPDCTGVVAEQPRPTVDSDKTVPTPPDAAGDSPTPSEPVGSVDDKPEHKD